MSGGYTIYAAGEGVPLSQPVKLFIRVLKWSCVATTKPLFCKGLSTGSTSRDDIHVVLTTVSIIIVMEDFQTGEETSFAVEEVSGIIKDVSYTH